MLSRKKILRHLAIGPKDSAHLQEVKKAGKEWTISEIQKKAILFHPEMKQLKVLKEDERANVLKMLKDELDALEERESMDNDLNQSRPTNKRPADVNLDNIISSSSYRHLDCFIQRRTT